MRDSKQVAKILFLCLLFAWFRMTADGRVSAKFPTCVTDTFCVWLKMVGGKKGFLLGASNCEKGQLASSCLSVRLCTWTQFHEAWNLNIFRRVMKIKVSRKSANKTAL